MILFIHLRLIIAVLTAIGLIALTVLWLLDRDKKLAEFRAQLKPGQMVRLLRPNGSTVRARIIIKNSDFHFVAIDIDTKVRHFTAASCIYKP